MKVDTQCTQGNVFCKTHAVSYILQWKHQFLNVTSTSYFYVTNMFVLCCTKASSYYVNYKTFLVYLSQNVSYIIAN